MSKEAIDAVLAAEREAKEKKEAAAKAAQEDIARASDEAKAKFEAAREAAAAEMNETLSEIESQSEERLKKNKAEAESFASSETRGAMSHMDDAVKLIIGELMKNAGN